MEKKIIIMYFLIKRANNMDELKDFREALRAFEEEFKCSVVMHAHMDEVRKSFAFLCGIHTNPYCSVMKKKLWESANPLCNYFDCKLVGEMLNEKKKPFYKFCHCAVLEIAAPVIINGELGATLYIGPFRVSEKKMPPGTLISRTFIKGLRKFEKQKRLLTEMSEEKASRLIGISLMLSNMIRYITEKNSANEEVPGSRKEHIENFIKNHFRKNISLSELASYLFLSESRTTQLLREYFGKGFPELLTEQRLNYAKTLLANSYFTASSIALQAGFSEASYFFKVFMKSAGMSPGAYRRKFRKENFQA